MEPIYIKHMDLAARKKMKFNPEDRFRMELTGLLTTCVAIPVLLCGWVASEDTFAFDCYSDTGFGHLERAVVLNCSGKALASTAGLGTWLLQHATFAELLAKPKIELTLSFDSNAIRTVGVFPHLPRARRLSLSRNLIQEILPGAFTNLTNLHELDLSHNLITGKALNPDVFRGAFSRELYEPLSVKILNLSGNQIHSLSRSVFEHLQFLEQLDLDNNPIKIVDHTTTLAFSTLSRLKWLDMGYTQLKKIPGEMLRHTPIQTLYLNGNKLEAIPRSSGSCGGP
ncbi:podocan isoform X1 [Bemisia tabaci]|uniref:podocan isoform X1 n=2 Tax=Bemisia tabaci TaxID=7038 RepID=UPI003B2883D8